MKFPPWIVQWSIHINHATGGPTNYSLCARFWEARLNGVFGAKALCWFVDKLFWFDPQHCRKSWLRRNPR